MDGKTNSNLLVRDIIKAIENKELKIIDLANQYGFSDRTIQTKIKNLGFEWDAKEGKHNFIGTDESVFNIAIEEVFKKAVPSASKSTVRREVKNEAKNASKEVASSLQKDIKDNIENTPENNSKNNSNITSTNTSKRNSKKASDNIDRLLAGKKAKKEYRGFYLDSDIAGIVDNVNSGIKSELVNECLRKVFKEKGLL